MKLTSGKILALTKVLHVPNKFDFWALLAKVRVKVLFEFDKIAMTKNNIFVKKGYCNQGLFVLNIDDVMNENISSSDCLLDYIDMSHARTC